MLSQHTPDSVWADSNRPVYLSRNLEGISEQFSRDCSSLERIGGIRYPQCSFPCPTHLAEIMYTFSKGWSVRVYICVYFRHYPPPIFCLQGLCRIALHSLTSSCYYHRCENASFDCYPFRLSFPDLLSYGTCTEVRLLGGHSL